MKEHTIVALSDTHNRHRDIKAFQNYNPTLDEERVPLSGNIITHAGDATSRGNTAEVEDFLEWYGNLNFNHKIFVPGNHDFLFEYKPKEARALCEKYGVTLLNHESITIEGINFFGSPWTPWFYDWAFNGARTEAEQLQYSKQDKIIPLMKDLWKDIPKGTDILITHGPAYEVLDEVLSVCGDPTGRFVGCEDLRDIILEIKPDIHICGHIHCGYGEKHLKNTSYYNVSICDEMYSPSNAIKEITFIK